MKTESPLNLFESLREFTLGNGKNGQYYALPQLEQAGVAKVSQLPVSIRIILESVLRNYDETRISEDDVRRLANWQPQAKREHEVPFVVARILLQDFTGVPVLVDLAAMRAVTQRHGGDPSAIEPLVPVDLVVDHSVQVDYSRTADALQRNMAMEFKRNQPRYQFLKWGMQAFQGFHVIPPGIGIVHQVNLEYLAQGVMQHQDIYCPDTLVGTDSHTTMINGLGIVGWGVGGIEAEAGMLGQPVYILTPDVVGVHLSGSLQTGVTATDLVLRITQMLREAGVVGKFVEFHGQGAANLSAADRATVANMAPEYGATIGFFPVDEETCRYFEATGRAPQHVATIRSYYQAQDLFGMPKQGELSYTQTLELDLATVEPSVAGPKRPQDRVSLTQVKSTFEQILTKPIPQGGYGKNSSLGKNKNAGLTRSATAPSRAAYGGGSHEWEGHEGTPLQSAQDSAIITELEMVENRPTPDPMDGDKMSSGTKIDLRHGDVVIAAITSCTNTSNPSVMLAAGLLAQKAGERGLHVPGYVKTSLAPGSRVVTAYLEATGLQNWLDRLGFQTVGYGCTTCIGNSGPLAQEIEDAISAGDLVVVSVLSGNRNFEARIHQSVKANFLMSPPLVVAFALAGRIAIDFDREPIGQDTKGAKVYLRDLWPTQEEIKHLLHKAQKSESYKALYRDFADQTPKWKEIDAPVGQVYQWDAASTYIQEPPFFADFAKSVPGVLEIKGARPLAIFGDSVTTDHISPAGAIKASSPAGLYLQELGVQPAEFNSYGSRRGNHEVMIRGTFANVRIKNLMVPNTEGGITIHYPSQEQLSIYDAAMRYQKEKTALVVFAGKEYGTGSSRDWAAKGTLLLGVKAVIAESFERIHRSNLIGMGVLPCQFQEGTSLKDLSLNGSETFDLEGYANEFKPGMGVSLRIHRQDGKDESIPLKLRLDTGVEVDYYSHGGILPYVLRQIMK